MRSSRLIRPVILALTAAAALPAVAQAEVGHVVVPGETLWTIAAANNLTTRTLAAHNGVSDSAGVMLGSTVRVPTTAEGYASLQQAGIVPASPASAPTATTAVAKPSEASPATTPVSNPCPSAMGGYTVRAGDTLSGLAAGARVGVSELASMNGLAADAQVVTGTVLKLPTGAPAPARASEPAPTATVVPKADPQPVGGRVGASQISSIAAANGVPGSLASAIAWQESGFNNDRVSSANARGVMQVMPGTWTWVEQNLARRKLDPASPTDNVNAGVLYVKHLLKETGGDENATIAAYYQGLGAVRSRGLFDDTKQYVANVQALRSRFGG